MLDGEINNKSSKLRVLAKTLQKTKIITEVKPISSTNHLFQLAKKNLQPGCKSKVNSKWIMFFFYKKKDKTLI